MPDLPDLAKHAAHRFDRNTAIMARNYSLSFTELDRIIGRIAWKLNRAGLKSGQTVALQWEWDHPILPVILAFFRIQVTVALIDPQSPSAPALFDQIRADYAFCANNSFDDRSLPVDLFVNHPGSGEYVAGQPIPASEPATIIFTSGSSAQPKGVIHSYGNHYFSALGSNENITLCPGDKWLNPLPLHHVGGLSILFRTLLGGGAMILSQKSNSLVDEINYFRPTHISLVATQFQRLLQAKNPVDWSNFKAILLGGSAIPPRLIGQAYEVKLPVFTSYGSTEMASQIATTRPNESLERLHSSGKLLKYRELMISTENEICVRGKTRCLGYLNPDGSRHMLANDTWLPTRDLGYWDADGYLHLFGRKDNMFISGGENIQPEEIEMHLLSMNTIRQALVVPVSHPEFGYRPAAFIDAGDDPIPSLTEIREYLRGYLPKFKMPDAVFPWPAADISRGIKVNRQKLIAIAEKLARRNCKVAKLP